jgi:hypothetical protein
MITCQKQARSVTEQIKLLGATITFEIIPILTKEISTRSKKK